MDTGVCANEKISRDQAVKGQRFGKLVFQSLRLNNELNASRHRVIESFVYTLRAQTCSVDQLLIAPEKLSRLISFDA